ncbi:carbon-nitrogen hydrolase family protein [Cardiobacteriaceae bacterium TAE3-ERU3]|nr:carbon-nitrogen hydrolase family protein [Cardiobacteriaceae bacterium TAE3-ERU3]
MHKDDHQDRNKLPLKVAGIQFAASSNWQLNLDYCSAAIRRVAAQGASLIVLPECALHTREPGETTLYAQPLDGEFVSALCALSAELGVCIVAGITEPSDEERIYNTAVVIQNGALSCTYRKLHLYDAFAFKESDSFIPGDNAPVTFTHQGLTFGVMTCYDLRFPELARLLAEQGADAIILPTSWFAGDLKEWHWQVLCAARALENGVYVLGVDACGTKRIGLSRLVDPYGVTTAQVGSTPADLIGTIDPDMIAQARHSMPLLSQRRFKIDPTVQPIASHAKA